MTAELVVWDAAPLDGEILLSATEARALTEEIRGNLVSLRDRIREARLGRADLALGYHAWHEYVRVEFGNIAEMRLPVEERRALVGSMVEDGLSVREIRAETDYSLGTIQADKRALGMAPERKPLAPAALPAPEGKVFEQCIEWLRRHPDGLTLAELARVASWSEGKASGALSDVVRRKKLAVRTEDWRGGMRIHRAIDGSVTQQ